VPRPLRGGIRMGKKWTAFVVSGGPWVSRPKAHVVKRNQALESSRTGARRWRQSIFAGD